MDPRLAFQPVQQSQIQQSPPPSYDSRADFGRDFGRDDSVHETIVDHATSRKSMSVMNAMIIVMVVVLLAVGTSLGLRLSKDYGSTTSTSDHGLQENDRFRLSGFRSNYFPPQFQGSIALGMTSSTGAKETLHLIPGQSFQFKHLFFESETYTVSLLDPHIDSHVVVKNPTGVFKKQNICSVLIEYHGTIDDSKTLIPVEIGVVQTNNLTGEIKVKVQFGNIRERIQVWIATTDKPWTHGADWNSVVEKSNMSEFVNPQYLISADYVEDMDLYGVPNRFCHLAWMDGLGHHKTIMNIDMTVTVDIPQTPDFVEIKESNVLATCPRLIARIDTKVSDPGFGKDFEVHIYDSEQMETPIDIIPVTASGLQEYLFLPFRLDLVGSRTYYARVFDTKKQIDSRLSQQVVYTTSP